MGLVGGPAQSASQLLRAMRLDRGLSKGRDGLNEREQQPHMGMRGTPGRLTGQGHQARYHLVIKGIIYEPACKLGHCAQISLASSVGSIACSCWYVHAISMCTCHLSFANPLLHLHKVAAISPE